MAARIRGLYYGAAATTAVAGILHLILATNALGLDLNVGVFFSVAGIAQLIWVVPMIKRWGRPWYYVGIGGTAVLIILYMIILMPDNPITGRAVEIDPIGIVTKLLEAAFIGLTAAIIVRESRLKEIDAKKRRKTDTEAA
jgi:hypothetical protein